MGSLELQFPIDVDLDQTMNIQIPALAWNREGTTYVRSFCLGQNCVQVTASLEGDQICFSWTAPRDIASDELPLLIRHQFHRTIADLDVGSNPVWKSLQHWYRGVVLMRTTAYEALVLTILSQNKTGEAVRSVFPRLAVRYRGPTAALLARAQEPELRKILSQAGPYKAKYMIGASGRVAAMSEERFDEECRRPTSESLPFLEDLPGVAHKTAACVLVFAAQNAEILPVDTHLFRIANRLGLAQHTGKLNRASRDFVIKALLTQAPDASSAHLLFVLLGRQFCFARKPRCRSCPIREVCPSANTFNQDDD